MVGVLRYVLGPCQDNEGIGGHILNSSNALGGYDFVVETVCVGRASAGSTEISQQACCLSEMNSDFQCSNAPLRFIKELLNKQNGPKF